MTKLLSKAQLIEEHDYVEEVTLKRGLKIDGEVKTKCLMREYITKDQTEVRKDRRAANNEFEASVLLMSKIVYIEITDDQYRNISYDEMQNMKGLDQNILVSAMKKISGEAENL